ncbi:MAG TPA: DUF2974 domain-containing protein [Candidatus Pullichristensenella excrementigallinarum]|uniref:DUF2974 domain-containing protein n=1 Tax=Candidatus Pullichristensenella excrementigallinarum TaxID=2840907 RepID=A0A9D1LCR8_9FIRM|nr:DUF2974 domain-containing protein [Candidatus Pullichristensenella excrementigallinarum]
MNPEMLLNLCSFSYFDLPQNLVRRLETGETVPLAAAAARLKRMNERGTLRCGAYLGNIDAMLDAIAGYSLDILAYENDNRDTGFVAYAFGSGDREVIAAMRGSERAGECAPTNVDWRDNFCAPLVGSVQYAEAARFLDRFPEGSLLATGHSKGGNVALWAQSRAQNPLARAAVFNAQGFAKKELTSEQIARMRRGAVNYVVAGDPVGALLYHPEIRVYIRQVPGTNPHAPNAYTFNAEGWPVRAHRTLASIGIEALSRLLVSLNESDGFVRRALQFLTTRVLRCPNVPA